jgi:hypothetical protein
VALPDGDLGEIDAGPAFELLVHHRLSRRRPFEELARRREVTASDVQLGQSDRDFAGTLASPGLLHQTIGFVPSAESNQAVRR